MSLFVKLINFGFFLNFSPRSIFPFSNQSIPSPSSINTQTPSFQTPLSLNTNKPFVFSSPATQLLHPIKISKPKPSFSLRAPEYSESSGNTLQMQQISRCDSFREAHRDIDSEEEEGIVEDYYQFGEISRKRVRLVKLLDGAKKNLQAEKPPKKLKGSDLCISNEKDYVKAQAIVRKVAPSRSSYAVLGPAPLRLYGDLNMIGGSSGSSQEITYIGSKRYKCDSSQEAEFKAIREGLQEARKLKLKSIILCSDSFTRIAALRIVNRPLFGTLLV